MGGQEPEEDDASELPALLKECEALKAENAELRAEAEAVGLDENVATASSLEQRLGGLEAADARVTALKREHEALLVGLQLGEELVAMRAANEALRRTARELGLENESLRRENEALQRSATMRATRGRAKEATSLPPTGQGTALPPPLAPLAVIEVPPPEACTGVEEQREFIARMLKANLTASAPILWDRTSLPPGQSERTLGPTPSLKGALRGLAKRP